MKVDKIDEQILQLLQSNARMTIKEISKELGLSSTPIFERIKRLERDGVIDRYVALLNKEKLKIKVTAFVEISLKEHAKEAVESFVSQVEKFEEVMEIYHTTGESDFLIKVVVKDMDAFNAFVITSLPMVPNLGKINSKFALTCRKYTTAVKV